MFTHERRLGGLLSKLRIEPREGAGHALSVKDLSFGSALAALFDDGFGGEFLGWVAGSANDLAWISWVSQRWNPVDDSGVGNAPAA